MGVEVEREEVMEIMNRFDRFCEEPDEEVDPRKNTGDRIFEELQAKWREQRGGMDASDLRPEFRALLAPLNIRVDMGCRKAPTPKARRLPRVGEDAMKEFTQLASEGIDGVGQASLEKGISAPRGKVA